MKRTFPFLAFLSILYLPEARAQTSKQTSQHTTAYSNPLNVKLGDPYVLHTQGTYYMYGTGGADKGFAAYSSKDLVNWKPEGQVYFHNNPNGWSDTAAAWGGAYWAPEVYEVRGKYYLFYSAQWIVNPTNEMENFRIGVAVADSPTGPFIDLANKPVFDPGYPVLDANVFFNDDGKMYLYYSRACYKHPVKSDVADWATKKGWYKEVEESWVYGVQLKPDFSGVIGEPVLLLRPPVKLNDKQSEWESRSVTSHEVNRRWTEGSVTFKKDGLYYIMYSSNHFGGQYYAVGYATGRSPLGPFTKAANNPVLQKNTAKGGSVTGTGHNSVAWSPDGKEMYCVYHARTSKTGGERVVFIDRMQVKNGRLVVFGPTTTPQKLPSGASLVVKTNGDSPISKIGYSSTGGRGGNYENLEIRRDSLIYVQAHRGNEKTVKQKTTKEFWNGLTGKLNLKDFDKIKSNPGHALYDGIDITITIETGEEKHTIVNGNEDAVNYKKIRAFTDTLENKLEELRKKITW